MGKGDRTAAILACALAALAASTQAWAGEKRHTLAVSATVVASCQVAVRVPTPGSPGSASGSGHFSIECTRKAIADASVDPVASAPGTPLAMQRMQLARHRADYVVTRGPASGSGWSAATRDPAPGIGVEAGVETVVASILF